MRAFALAATLLLFAGFALAAAPVATASAEADIWCDAPYTGVDAGSVMACCDFRTDPTVCYFRPI